MYSWKIWYSNNITIEGITLEDWQNAQEEGVVGIVEFFGYSEDGVKLSKIHMGSDWYWFHNGTISQTLSSHPSIGFWFENTAPLGAISKKGQYVSDEFMDYVQRQILLEIK